MQLPNSLLHLLPHCTPPPIHEQRPSTRFRISSLFSSASAASCIAVPAVLRRASLLPLVESTPRSSPSGRPIVVIPSYLALQHPNPPAPTAASPAARPDHQQPNGTSFQLTHTTVVILAPPRRTLPPDFTHCLAIRQLLLTARNVALRHRPSAPVAPSPRANRCTQPCATCTRPLPPSKELVVEDFRHG